MACHPAFWKAFAASLPEMLASRATLLDRDENFRLLPIWIAGIGLLIFRPEPGGDSFLNVGESFLFVFSLRHASGQGRAFDNNPPILRFFELHMEDHVDILPSLLPAMTRETFAVA